MPARPAAHVRTDLAVGILLAGLLTLGWTISGWSDLVRLRLPDTDDVMRLQQVRDWLGGQRFSDVAQHRLGAPPGLAMHWSRLGDLGPAAIMAPLQPLIGRHAAEVTAAIAWPALLFTATIALSASIARRLGAPAAIGSVIAALAYPVTTIFMPGRIDHHGLQLVLLLITVLATIGRDSRLSGAVAGIASAAALAIGLEHAPLFAVLGAAIVLRWAVLGDRDRLTGYAVALAGSIALSALLLRTDGWGYPACDGFNGTFWRAAQIAALGPLGLALAAPRLTSAKARLIAAGIAGLASSAAALIASPACLNPYGAVDPQLARLWLANVAEAQPLLGAPAAIALGYAGLAIAGCIATLIKLTRSREASWAIVAAVQIVAIAMMFTQLRGAYAAAALGIPGLAAMVAAARARGVLHALPAWLASAGLVYPVAAGAMAAPATGGPAGGCPRDDILARLNALPPARVLAPMDLGAYVVASTRHSAVAAPYHRNTAGNRALYATFLGTPEHAHQVARRWRIAYVIDCPGSFAELGGPGRGSLAAALHRGAPPTWLKPLPGGHIYVVSQ